MPKIGDYEIVEVSDDRGGTCITMSGPPELDRRCKKDPNDPPSIDIHNRTNCKVTVQLTPAVIFGTSQVDVDSGQTESVDLAIGIGGGNPSNKPIPGNDCEPKNPRKNWNVRIVPLKVHDNCSSICRPLGTFQYPPDVVVEC